MAAKYQQQRYLIFPVVSWLIFTILVSSCKTVSHTKKHPTNIDVAPRFRVSQNVTEEDRKRIATIAKNSLGKASLKVGKKYFRADCSGTVRAIYTKAHVGLGGIIKTNTENDVLAIYRYVQKYGKVHRSKPSPGELVFFHNTYDKSRNGRMNDMLTHVGIVERIDGTTIHFIHHLGQSIIRSRMDLSSPKNTYDTNQKKINDVLRRAQGQHRSYTAGELFAGFGRL